MKNHWTVLLMMLIVGVSHPAGAQGLAQTSRRRDLPALRQLGIVGNQDVGEMEETAQRLLDSSRRFRYDEPTGRCVDPSGRAGLNKISVPQLRATRDGECADLTRQNLTGASFKAFDFRGADFSGARLFFTDIEGADLRGAQLTTLSYGYAGITGRVDRFTTAPHRCTIEEQALTCHQ